MKDRTFHEWRKWSERLFYCVWYLAKCRPYGNYTKGKVEAFEIEDTIEEAF